YFLNRVNLEQQNNLLLNDRLKTANERLKEEQERLGLIQSELELEITKSSYKSIEEISAILAQTVDLNNEKAALQNYEQQLYSCKENRKKIQALMEDHVFDQETYEALLNEINLLKEEFKNINSNLIQAEALLKKQQEDHQHKLDLEKKLGELNSRA